MRRVLICILILAVCVSAQAENSTSRIVTVERGARKIIAPTPDARSDFARPDRPRNPLDQGGEDCLNAAVILSLPYCDTGTTIGYSDDYFEECLGVTGAPDVVYRFSPSVDQNITVSLTSSVYSTYLQIYETDIDCNDLWFYDCNNSVPTSCVEGLAVFSGYTYYIVVDGDWQESGAYTLNVTEGFGCVSDPCSGNTGETCGNAISIGSMPFHYEGTTMGMTDDYDFCRYEPGAPDIVFNYTPTYTHLADIITCGNTRFESSLYIFRDGNFGTPWYGCGVRSCYTFYSGYWPNAAIYCFEFEVGHSYCIVVDGAWSYSFGQLVLDISETSVEACDVGTLCPAPATETEPNDLCPSQFDPDTLRSGDTLAGTICQPGDQDLYYVETPEDVWNIVGVEAGPDCSPGVFDIGIAFLYPDGCYVTEPCNGCGWIHGCGPQVEAVQVAGLGSCYTGPYTVIVRSEPAPTDPCDPVACTTALTINCNVPTPVNSCDGCSSPICQSYRNGCSGPRGWTGPQKFYRLDVPATTDYTIDLAAADTTQDVQFSIFTDCVLPRTTCVFSQDQNYWAQNPTGPRWTETGTVSLDPGTYYLHVSLANSQCGDMNLLVSCTAAPCLPPDSVTIRWNTAGQAEIRFVSDGGTYDIFSTNFPNNDGDPRGGDPQWGQRATLFGPAGLTLWSDTDVSSAYRNYVIVKQCP